MDPADAGMDNPPEPVRDDYDVAALQRRVAAFEKRAVEHLNMNNRLLDRAEQAAARERVLREALEKILWLRPAGPTRNKVVEQMEVIARAALSAHKEGK